MEGVTEDEPVAVNVNILPNELLEYIFSLLSPYKDYKNVMLVCQRWQYIMKDVAEKEYQQFHEALSEGTLWWKVLPPAIGPTIAERYSHSACYINKCLYVFGGCTSKNTTFNDLWKFDLATAEWIRPLATGSYPSPKAYASLVAYKNKLVLFGGWSHPTPLSLHQSARFFQQLHTYTPDTNSWDEILTQRYPPGLAGHGACVINDIMVIFGGSRLNGISCNDIWVFDLIEHEWTLKTTPGEQPLPRYGHAQIVYDNAHILVVGGCGGPNMQFSDVWLLTLGPKDWRWEEITVLHMENCAPQLWCHPACKVGNKMVVLSKISKPPASSGSSSTSPQVRSPKPNTRPVYERPPGCSPTKAAGPTVGTRDHCCCCQEVSLANKMNRTLCQTKRTHPETSESSSQDSSSDNDDGTGRPLQSPPHRGGRSVNQKLTPEVNLRVCAKNSTSPNKPTVSVNESSGDSSPRQGAKNSLPPSTSRSPGLSLNRAMLPPLPVTAGSSGASTESCNASHPGGRSGLPSIRPNAMRNRQKQLEMLKRYEDRIKGQRAKDGKGGHSGSCCHGAGGPCKIMYPNRHKSQNPAYIHSLDLSELLERKTVSWLPLSDYGLQNAPEETIFYSLVEGRGELVMFGGIQTDMNNMRRHTQHTEVFSNAVYFLSPRKILR